MLLYVAYSANHINSVIGPFHPHSTCRKHSQQILPSSKFGERRRVCLAPGQFTSLKIWWSREVSCSLIAGLSAVCQVCSLILRIHWLSPLQASSVAGMFWLLLSSPGIKLVSVFGVVRGQPCHVGLVAESWFSKCCCSGLRRLWKRRGPTFHL